MLQTDVARDVALKTCFIIFPTVNGGGEARRRADHVLTHFIKPACFKAGYDAAFSDSVDDQDMPRGIRDSLLGSPMAIAYLGSRFTCGAVSPCTPMSVWNDGVMAEVGYRLAAHLPLVLISDGLDEATNPGLPLMMGIPRTFMIPGGRDELDPEDPADKVEIDGIVDRLVKRIRSLEADATIESNHAIALVHRRIDGGSDPSDPANMFFVGASPLATELFGFEDRRTGRVRLAGRTMQEFLENLRYRMHCRQYDEFLGSQDEARSAWTSTGGPRPWMTPSVHIPIVFDRHPRRQFVGRVYLPIIVSKFDSGASWSTLRVLYLDVTSATREVKDETGSVFVCEIDPQSKPLDIPAPSAPIDVFLCHNSLDKPVVERILSRLAELSPLSVHPWIDETNLVGGDKFVDEIGAIVRKADVALVFLGKNGLGPFQAREVDTLVHQVTKADRKKLFILPVLLDDVDPEQMKTPDSWELLSPEQYGRLDDVDSDEYLIRFFETHFPGRLVL